MAQLLAQLMAQLLAQLIILHLPLNLYPFIRFLSLRLFLIISDRSFHRRDNKSLGFLRISPLPSHAQ